MERLPAANEYCAVAIVIPAAVAPTSGGGGGGGTDRAAATATGATTSDAEFSRLSASALPLVLASDAVAKDAWLQLRATAVCRAWRAAALDESCCAELALGTHEASARWLHDAATDGPEAAQEPEQQRPWLRTVRRMQRAEVGWQRGAGYSRLLHAAHAQVASPPSILQLARCRGPGADSAGAQTLLATSCFDGRVELHCVRESREDQPTFETVGERRHGTGPVDCCSLYAPTTDTLLLASGSREQTVKLWRLDGLRVPDGGTLLLAPSAGAGDGDTAHESSPDDSAAAAAAPAAEWVGCGGRVMDVDCDGALCVAGFQYAAATPPGPRFASRFARPEGSPAPPSAAASVKPLRVWDVTRCQGSVDDGALKLLLPPKRERHSVACVRLLQGGQRVIAANIRGHVHAHDLRQPKTLIQTICSNELGWAVLAMDAGGDDSPGTDGGHGGDGSVFLSLADQRLVEYDWRRCESAICSVEVPDRPARSLAVDRRRQRMITGGNEDNGVVRFWDLGSWRRQQQQQSGGSIDTVAIDRTDSLCGQAMEGAHSDYVSGVALCGLECWVSASLDGTLCAWTLDGNGAR